MAIIEKGGDAKMEQQDHLLNTQEVLKLFDGHVTYGGLLALVRTKQLKAAKINGKLLFIKLNRK